MSILTDEQNKIKMRHYHLDPLSSIQASQRSNVSKVSEDLTAHPEDEKLREVLDEIDVKIGQAIEEKECEYKEMQLLQKQIREAKDCFTNAYKQYKAIRNADKEVDEYASARFNEAHKNSIDSVKEKMQSMVSDKYQSID
jgi:hypothetical protein